MESLKRECDKEAHKGAKRMAVGGFGLLLAYWGTVFRLTFYDFGWYVFSCLIISLFDVMKGSYGACNVPKRP
jgi:hypothetical protein